MTTPKKTPSLIGYYLAHVGPKDATIIPVLNPTFFVLKDYHIKIHPPQLLTKFIEFTYCNDRFLPATQEAKTNKYKPMIENIVAIGWKIDPSLLLQQALGPQHTSMKLLEDKFKLPMSSIRYTFKNINTIAIQYAMFILLHKRRF
jgi:hypothetical protein